MVIWRNNGNSIRRTTFRTNNNHSEDKIFPINILKYIAELNETLRFLVDLMICGLISPKLLNYLIISQQQQWHISCI